MKGIQDEHPTVFHNAAQFISYQFSVLRLRAQRGQLWMKLSGMRSELLIFPGSAGRLNLTRRLLGLKSIRVAEIVGTLNRATDFDHEFRPLKKHALPRWVNAYLLHERDGWSPIVVHKVGQQYFVEDGHHRVSVARALGMEFMEATVWEYSYQEKPLNNCQPVGCVEKRSTEAYSAG